MTYKRGSLESVEQILQSIHQELHVHLGEFGLDVLLRGTPVENYLLEFRLVEPNLKKNQIIEEKYSDIHFWLFAFFFFK